MDDLPLLTAVAALLVAAPLAQAATGSFDQPFDSDPIADGPWGFDGTDGSRYAVEDGELNLTASRSGDPWAFARAYRGVNLTGDPVEVTVAARDVRPNAFLLRLDHPEDIPSWEPVADISWTPDSTSLRATTDADGEAVTVTSTSLAGSLTGPHLFRILVCYGGGIVGWAETPDGDTLGTATIDDAEHGPEDVRSIELFTETFEDNSTYAVDRVTLDVEPDASRCVPFDDAPPQVAITSPEEGTVNVGNRTVDGPGNRTVVAGTHPVEAEAGDAESGVEEVRFRVDGETRAVDATRPYGFSWDTTQETPGKHELSAQAVDGNGNTATGTRSVVVAGPGP